MPSSSAWGHEAGPHALALEYHQIRGVLALRVDLERLGP
jgi:hypothetical protein